MEYKVGSLADLISGTRNSSSTRESVVYVPFEKNKTTPEEASQKPATSRRRKRKVNWEEQGEEEKNEEFSKGNSEEEDENEEEKLSTRPPKVRRKAQIIRNTEHELRTIFVKNIPHIIDKKRLKKIFKKYGTIECVRFRCAPQGDTRIPKKVTVIKKEFHPERTNISAFIRFYSKESVEKALKANGSLIEGHHIYVDRAVQGNKHDQKKAIFLGNVPFAAEENEIRNVFEDCGEIQDIRIVRDRETGLGKGFAFVNFKSADSVELAINLQGVKVRDNELRVMRGTKKMKQTSSQPKGKAFTSKRNSLRRTGQESNWKSNKKNLKNKVVLDVKERSFSNREYVNRNEGKKYKSKHTDFNKKEKHQSFSVESNKQPNIPSQVFQGQQMSDKKKKKQKFNKNEQRKKKISKILTSR